MSSVIKKVMLVGGVTTFMLILALLAVGLASTALAGTGVRGRFDVGKANTVNAITKLVGSVTGSSPIIDNDSTNPNAAALDLRVEAGKAPMKVNSDGRVTNLNADKLDGQDASAFMPARARTGWTSR